MVENSSPRVSSKGKAVAAVPTGKNKDDAIDGVGDSIDCSGKYCRSCTAGVIADCVALCCCPCAVLNLLTLALVKVPWKMGRRCLGFGKKKRIRAEMERKCQRNGCNCNGVDDHSLTGEMLVEREMWEFSKVFGEKEKFVDHEEIGNFSSRFEAEKVWLELYQVGHLGFGRVSFTAT